MSLSDPVKFMYWLGFTVEYTYLEINKHIYLISLNIFVWSC